MKHELKVQPQFWDAIADGSNPSNIRRDDRKFRIGDVCELKRYDPSHGFTGQSIEKVITHILMPEDFPNGLPAGYVILGFGQPKGEPFYIAWNGKRTEGFVTEVEADAITAKTNEMSYELGYPSKSTIAEAFFESYGDDGEVFIEEITICVDKRHEPS